jgi:hypothetical protein
MKPPRLQTEAIEKLFETACSSPLADQPQYNAGAQEQQAGPAFMLGLGSSTPTQLPTAKDMRSLLRAPIPNTLRAVQALLTEIVLVPNMAARDINTGDWEVLPECVSDSTLFRTLPHLVCPGLLFTLRPAALIALIAWQSGNALLKPRAESFLLSIKGEWLPLDTVSDFPELLSVPYVNLLTRNRLAMELFLTECETATYTKLRLLHRTRKALPAMIDVAVPFTPKLVATIPDLKEQCRSCNHTRSFTVMVDGVCGLCLWDVNESRRIPEPKDCDKDSSHMVECGACACLYAVTCVDDLNIAPKCHYCRRWRNNSTPPPPSVQCDMCLNKFVCPTARSEEWTSKFRCGVCTKKPAQSVVQVRPTLTQLVKDNPLLLTRAVCLPVSLCVAVIMPGGAGSLFKMYSANESEFGSWTMPTDPAAAADGSTGSNVTIEVGPLPAADAAASSLPLPQVIEQDGQELLQLRRGKVIHAGALSKVFNTIAHASLYDMCNLCCETLPLDQLHSACGACENLTCGECLGAWYGQLKPGQLVQLSHLTCPFCKRSPHGKTLMRYNRVACGIKRSAQAIADRHDFYFGWCTECFQVKPAIQKSCANGVPELKGFKCEECLERARARVLVETQEDFVGRTRKCPGCTVMVEKVTGCDHITCGCDAHWCWNCGFMAPESEPHGDSVYEHMYAGDCYE